jgi:acetyl-CoA acetyltransferase
MDAQTLRGKAAVAGVGETTYYRRGGAPDPETALALQAIIRAAESAGLNPKEIDGFVSLREDDTEHWDLAASLGVRELRFSARPWGGGGGAGAGATAIAAAAIATGQARRVAVFRAISQKRHRHGQGSQAPTVSGWMALHAPYGELSPAQLYAPKIRRFMHDHGVRAEALRAIALAANRHAQANPRALMYGKPLTAADYDAARFIVEPLRLYDCCLESDGAAAMIIVSPEEARDGPNRPCFIVGAAMGAGHRNAAGAFGSPEYGQSHFGSVAPRLWAMAKVSPAEVDVAQCYDHFTGGVLMSLVDHGLVAAEAVNEFFTVENLSAPGGRLPLNTSGGNLAEAYIHGVSLQVEAVRQIWGQSTSQVEDVALSLSIAGSMTFMASSVLFGSEETVN